MQVINTALGDIMQEIKDLEPEIKSRENKLRMNNISVYLNYA